MYLPTLAIDFREHFKNVRTPTVKVSPSTQVVILHALLCKSRAGLRPLDLAARFGYSPMTLSRAFSEIERTGIGEITTVGRERQLSFTAEARDLWENAASFLRSPVKQEVFILQPSAAIPGLTAGLSALANYSMLAEPNTSVYAMDATTWKRFAADPSVEVIPGDEPRAEKIEVWRYAPTFFADGPMVDRLSLYLSLRDDKDERVEAALEQMIEEMPW
jgi:DNA-binding MarR family transcriptional regulator